MVLVQWFNGLNSTSKSQKPNVKNNNSVDYYESQILLADSLYKNYLPQYNFEEVKKAMEFFDSCQSSAVSRQCRGLFNKKVTDENKLIADRRLLTAAKAHYYHAVGLTEKDDVVGACEHYLRALEIMEPLVGTSPLWRPETNDKGLKASRIPELQNSGAPEIRFIALIYNRLGRMFYNENYCDLAITKYRKALEYVEILCNNDSKANVLKELGNSYQLANKPDSALYYYNESLKYNSSLPNKLDVEKSIAKILFYKDEKDSAYKLIKNNLDKINTENIKYSYHHTLGDMFYVDKKYDSAIYYLETSLDNNIISKKIAFTTKLSAIYDSIGDYDKRDYYDNLSSRMLLNYANIEVDKSQLQILYNNYKERKTEKENSIAKAKTRNITITIILVVLVVVMFVIIYIRYNHRKVHNKLKNEIDNRTKDIENKNIIINQKEHLINEYQRTNERKDEIIMRQSEEIQNLINKKTCAQTYGCEAFYSSEICRKILGEKEETYTALSAAELSLLLDAANENMDNIINKIKARYPQLNTDDMYYICLILLNISKNGISYLMGRTRKTVWLRIKTIKLYMNLGDNDDLLAFLKSIV